MTTPLRIGIDLGGTKIEGVLFEPADLGPRIIVQKRIPTQAHLGYGQILRNVQSLVKILCEKAPDAPIGVGMPGSLTAAGLVKNSNTVCLNGTPFRQELAADLERSVRFANDANCFALAEAKWGAGRGYELVFGVIMGTGVGGGIVYNNVLRDGPQSICGEWGHMTLERPSDCDCYCGKSGCVELFLSGPGVENQYKEMGGSPLALLEILKGYKVGEQPAKACVEKWMDNFGLAMANVINVLDPDVVVLGGGVSNASCLYDTGIQRIGRYIFSDTFLTPVVQNQLGDSAGVLGAGLLGLDE